MSRIARPSGFSPKMYRHFAVITVVITALLAMFADGEQRNAIADEIAARQARAQARQAQEASTNRTLAVRAKHTAAGFASDPAPRIDNTINSSLPGSRSATPPRALPRKLPKGTKQVAIPSGPYPGWMDEKAPPGLIELFAAQQQGRINGPQDVSADQLSRIDDAARERSGASEKAD